MNDVVWQTVPFEQLVEFHDRRRIPLSKRERADRSGPFPYYGAQGIIDWLDDFIFDGRYLLIAEDGENLNSRKQPVAFVADGRFWVNNHAHVVKAIDGLADDDFLRAYVEFHPLNGLITGAAQPKLSQSNLKRLQVAAPPYPVQARIGSVIRALDDLIDNNRRRIEILEEMARLLYREWFVHFRFPGHEDVELIDSELGPIPEGWEVSPTGDVFDSVGGGTPSKKEPSYWDNGDIDWFTPSDLTKSGTAFMFRSEDRINGLGLKKSSAKLFPAGSVMMTSRATVGVVAIAACEASTNQGFITCVPNDRVSSEYLYLWLQSQVKSFLQLAGGATFKELRKSDFRDYKLAVPPEALMAKFGQMVRSQFDLVANLIQQNEILREARDLLLPRLVSGELDVTELELDGVLA